MEKLEIYRYFRFKFFNDINKFYYVFFSYVDRYGKRLSLDITQREIDLQCKNYLHQFTFYSFEDRKFRLLRDEVLSIEQYNFLMDKMMEDYGVDVSGLDFLWMNREDILDLSRNGNIIGLHSHSHPTAVAKLSYDEQMNEYRNNKDIIENITNKAVFSASYPCNSYNEDSEKIFSDLGITLAFDAVMDTDTNSSLHIPRWDHAYVLAEMGK